MSIKEDIRKFVQQRASYACEFCGVQEEDTGDILTIDHFQPQSKQGADELDNLIYCCNRCNLYKSDYFPSKNHAISLWNPRIDPQSKHFLELENGHLQGITDIGIFTIIRLRLNRILLISYRLKKRKRLEETQLLIRYQSLVLLLNQLNQQLTHLTEEQRILLEEQRRLLLILMDNK